MKELSEMKKSTSESTKELTDLLREYLRYKIRKGDASD